MDNKNKTKEDFQTNYLQKYNSNDDQTNWFISVDYVKDKYISFRSHEYGSKTAVIL